ncbi:hypothetical protein ACS5NO_10410 [Larkinella sp. GY13]|uniref:hypothetical protein n=1 Tax=Larkinella sp. GY13 TaxID=3453720 RepID=UPI003EE9A1AF
MDEKTDILELRFTGSGITPASIKAKESSKLLLGLEDALLAVVKRDNPDINLDEIYLSITSIRNQSADYGLTPSIKSVFVAALLSVSASLESGSLDDLPVKTIKGLQLISKFVKSHQCSAELRLNSAVQASIHPDTNIEIPNSAYIDGDTTIYATVARAGGKNPTVHLRLSNNDELIYVHTTKHFAKQLAQRLYDKVGLYGTARWERVSRNIVEFTIKDITDYEGLTSYERFKELTKNIGKHWDKVNNIESVLMRDDFDE